MKKALLAVAILLTPIACLAADTPLSPPGTSTDTEVVVVEEVIVDPVVESETPTAPTN